MENFLTEKINLTINNYRLAKEYLRNDGELLNHYASLVFAHYDEEIPIELVKKIRKYIKNTSTRMSPFRGELLYLLSFLLAKDGQIYEEIVDEIYETIDILSGVGFKMGEHLALAAYVVARYGRGKNKYAIADKMKGVYGVLKEKYHNITGEDDYLICALWALNDIEPDTIHEFIELVFEQVKRLKIKSKNGVQGLTNALILNGSSGHMYRTAEFIIQLQKRDIKLAHQFLPLLGVLSNVKPRMYADICEGVIEYLCEEEAEYEFYMDKGFRTIISIVIVSFCTIQEERRYINELLAHGVYCFVRSKNKGVFSEILI